MFILVGIWVLDKKFLWMGFFASFATKMPMIPMRIWLSEVHVEALTSGLIILAGLLLKLGTYGILRLSLPIFYDGYLFFYYI